MSTGHGGGRGRSSLRSISAPSIAGDPGHTTDTDDFVGRKNVARNKVTAIEMAMVILLLLWLLKEFGLLR